MSGGQDIHPLRHTKTGFRDREFIQDRAQDLQNVLLCKRLTVDRQTGGVILRAQVGSQRFRTFSRRVCRVEQDKKRFSDITKFCDNTRLRRCIILPRKLGHAPSVVTTMPIVEWSRITFRVPSSAATRMGTS